MFTTEEGFQDPSPPFPGQKSAKSSCIKSTYKANKLELALCHFNLADLARDKNAKNSPVSHRFDGAPRRATPRHAARLD